MRALEFLFVIKYELVPFVACVCVAVILIFLHEIQHNLMAISQLQVFMVFIVFVRKNR